MEKKKIESEKRICSEVSVNSPGNPWRQSWRKKEGTVGRICRKGMFQAWNERVTEQGGDGWWEWWVDGIDGRSATHKTRWARTGEISAWLAERSRELIPETRGSILEGTICYSQRRWCGWASECDQRWRASATRRLNCDKVMQTWRLGGCENFVGTVSEKLAEN